MTDNKTIIRYATFAVEVTEDWLTDGGDMTAEEGWQEVEKQVRRLRPNTRWAWESESCPIVSFEEWQPDEEPDTYRTDPTRTCTGCAHAVHNAFCRGPSLDKTWASGPCNCAWVADIPGDIDPDYEAASDAARDAAQEGVPW